MFITYAKLFSLDVFSYEGGPDTSCFFDFNSSTPAKNEANLDPRIQSIVQTYLGYLRAMGGYTLSYFTCCTGAWTQFGQWTLAPNQTTYAGAPKRKAIEAVLAAAEPEQLFGAALPGTVDATLGAAGDDETVVPVAGPWTRPGVGESRYYPVRPSGGSSSTMQLRLNVTTEIGAGAVNVTTSGNPADWVTVSVPPGQKGQWALTEAVQVLVEPPFTTL